MLAIYSFAVPNTAGKLRFLLGPSFDEISGKIVLSTVKRTFFSVDVNVNYVYACTSCFARSTGLAGATKDITLVSAAVTFVTNLVVFPMIFSMPKLSTRTKPKLIFVALPGIFRLTFRKLP